MAKITKPDALLYHEQGRAGKIQVVPTKPSSSQRDLSLAYSPGVAYPCLEIKDNPDDVYRYTAKGNLVAVISNGTAVLGLGDIGAAAGKPVMEGKGVLFKIFADIDVFDIELDTHDVEKFIDAVKIMAPTFGGINLEDIKAPECFEIEQRLKAELDIPVMHDDQHGTAIISSAGLLNALELVGKKIEEVRIVVNGAGASAVSCTNLYKALGAKPENIVMVDSKGVLRADRTDLNAQKRSFATNRDIRTLAEALVDADMFLGLSVANVVTREMVKSMAKNPIVFALANPDPEIAYEEAIASRDDLIFATGRSDYPNQINNVLGFPFIFRGALDVRAKCINEEMKIAAVYALSSLTKEEVPEAVNVAYKVPNLVFGRNYIIPKPLDPRLIARVPVAVAKAAIASGVARHAITDWEKYTEELNKRMGRDNVILRGIYEKARQNPKKVVYVEANHLNVLKAAQAAMHEGIAYPILLGDLETIEAISKENELDLSGAQIIDVHSKEQAEKRAKYAHLLHEKRGRKGLTLTEAEERMFDRNYFGQMMVVAGDADAVVTGYAQKYADVVRTGIQTIGLKDGLKHLAGLNIMMTKKGPIFFADTTINFTPSTEVLIDTTLLAAEAIRKFGIEPVIAMLSYSNFGSSRKGSPVRVQDAVEFLHREHPELILDGEIQMDIAFNKELRDKIFGFNKLKGKDVNTIIFPNLSSGNIAYKMLQVLEDVETIGPILLGTNKPMHTVQIGSSVREIINITAIAVVDAQ
jgi:malate dehydrogenase (oxaloacetate-decarboxylating)(NADP+)